MHSVAERNPQAKLRFQLTLIAFLIVSIAFQTGAATETIIDRELTVIRGDYKEVHYLIPKGTTNARIQGSFTCKGGLNDDVSFFVFTKDQYVRWYSSHPNKPIFSLKKKKEGKFEFPVTGEETYYFVFDNFFSSVSNKQIKLQVKLIQSK